MTYALKNCANSKKSQTLSEVEVSLEFGDLGDHETNPHLSFSEIPTSENTQVPKGEAPIRQAQGRLWGTHRSLRTRWPAHQAQRITQSLEKLCTVHRSFIAMSGSWVPTHFTKCVKWMGHGTFCGRRQAARSSVAKNHHEP